MSAPGISVVIPAYNAAGTIAETLDSVLGQTCAPAEILVVDDGSTDGCGDIAAGKSVRVSRIEHGGIARARNHGVRQTSADILCFLDADDVWELHKLEIQLGYLRQASAPEIIFAQVVEFADAGLRPEEIHRLQIHTQPRPGPLPGNLMIRRADFERVGFFSEEFGSGEFVDWFSRARDLGLRHESLGQVLLHRRIHRANRSLEPDAQGELLRVLKKKLDRRRGGPAF